MVFLNNVKFWIMRVTYLHYLFNVFCFTMATATIVGAGISAAGSIGSALIGSGSSANLNSKNRKFQAEQAALARKHQEYMTKQYTSTDAQLRQLKENNINVNALYNSGSAPSSSVPSVNQAGEPQTFNPDFSAIANGANNIGNIIAQQDLVKAQAKKANSESTNIDAKTPAEVKKLVADGYLSEQTGALASKTLEFKVTQENEAAKQSLLQTTLLGLQEDNVRLDLDIKRFNLNNILPAQLQAINVSYQKDIAEIALFDEQTNLVKAQKDSVLAHIMIDWTHALAAQTNAKANMMNAQTNQMKAPSEIAANWSSAAESDARSEGQTINNRINGSTAQYVVDKTAKELQKLGKDVNTYEFRNVWLPVLLKSMDVGVKVGESAGFLPK